MRERATMTAARIVKTASIPWDDEDLRGHVEVCLLGSIPPTNVGPKVAACVYAQTWQTLRRWRCIADVYLSGRSRR